MRSNLEDQYIELFMRCDAWYECPKDPSGRRLGPLVGYAATDTVGCQLVGDIYANFAQVEQNPEPRRIFAAGLAQLVRDQFGVIDWVIGAPMGGIALAVELSSALHCQLVYAEKEVVKLATKTSREKSRLVLKRHQIRGGRGICAEDVCNNLSTPKDLKPLVEAADGELAAIACGLNRSQQPFWDDNGRLVPILSTIFRPLKQYRQSDPEVAADIAAGNVVLKPKAEWPRLKEAMARAKR